MTHRRRLAVALVVGAFVVATFLAVRGAGPSSTPIAPEGSGTVGDSSEASPRPDAGAAPFLAGRTAVSDPYDRVPSQGPAVLEGVVRRADGLPAARALVMACVPAPGRDTDVAPAAGTATTDSDGRYRIGLPRWPRELWGMCVVAWSRDRREASLRAAVADHLLTDEGVRHIDLDLVPTGTLEVRVHDSEDRAVPGSHALVWAAWAGEGNGWRTFPVDTQGRVRVDGIVGLVGVNAGAPGWQGIGGPVTVAPEGRTEVRRRLSRREGRLDARFLDEDGRPVVGLLVSAAGEKAILSGMRGTTDASGLVSLPWPFQGDLQIDPPARRWLVSSVDGVTTDRDQDPPTALSSDRVRSADDAPPTGTVSAEVRVRPGSRLRGTVRFANGTPAGPGLTVFSDGPESVVATDEDGRFEFDDTFLPGAYGLRCLGVVTRVSCATGDNDVVVQAPDAFRLEVRLLDASGARAWKGRPTGFTHVLHAVASHPRRDDGVPFGVFEDGRIVQWLERIPGEPWKVRVWMAPTEELGALEVDGPDRSGETVRADLRLSERVFGSLRCRLVDAGTGYPLASGALRLTAEGVPPAKVNATARWLHATDATRLEAALVPAGRWTLEASSSGFQTEKRSIDIPAGRVTDLGDVTLRAAPPK